MIAHDSLRDAWRRERARRLARYHSLPALGEDGLTVGPLTVLAKRVADRWNAPDLAFEDNGSRALALLAVAYWRPVSPAVIANLRRAAKAMARGDRTLAAIHVAHTGLEKIAADDNTAFRLFAAEKLLDTGVAPRELMTGLGLDPWPLDALAKFDPGQPRDDHGRWTSGGLDPQTQRRAETVYGETSGLRPALIDPKASPNNPANWDSASVSQLATARAYVGIVSDRNNKVNRATPPDLPNVFQSRAWDQAVDAANQGGDGSRLDPRITQFYMRQDRVGPQAPKGWTSHCMLSIGPFYSVGGGKAVARGPKTYVDFYGN